MGHINWSSLIAAPSGDIDMVKIGQLTAILLALGGGSVLILAMAGAIAAGQHMMLGVSALVLPLTGGKIAEGIGGLVHSRKVLAGQAPGRRDTDTHPVVPK